jgi:multidrug resistance efflux pump
MSIIKHLLSFNWRKAPGWLWRASDSHWQATDDTYLQSDLTPIAAKFGGYGRSTPVQDFEYVHAGQLLAQIVDDDYRTVVARLVASVSVAARRSRRSRLSGSCKARTSTVRGRSCAGRRAVGPGGGSKFDDPRSWRGQDSDVPCALIRAG